MVAALKQPGQGFCDALDGLLDLLKSEPHILPARTVYKQRRIGLGFSMIFETS